MARGQVLGFFQGIPVAAGIMLSVWATSCGDRSALRLRFDGGAGGGSAQPTIGEELARGWQWEPCGEIPTAVRAGDGVSAVRSLAISGAGDQLISLTGSKAVNWKVAILFGDSVPIWASGKNEEDEADISWDGRLVALSGFEREVLDGPSGRFVYTEPPYDATACLGGNHLTFSADGRFLAGFFQSDIQVLDTQRLIPVADLPSAMCGPNAAFSADGTLMASSVPELYRTSDWHRVWPDTLLQPPVSAGEVLTDSVKFAPDGQSILISHCGVGALSPCSASLYSVATGSFSKQVPLTAAYPSFSTEGQWIIGGGTLFHLPSGDTRSLDPSATVAIFAPNGDVIVGRGDGSLARYCRQEPP